MIAKPPYSLWNPPPPEERKTPFDGLEIDPEALKKAVKEFIPPDLSDDEDLNLFKTGPYFWPPRCPLF